MYLNEPIDLYVAYKHNSITPIAFIWKGKKYVIEKIHLTYEEKNGLYKKFIYSASIGTTYYKLSLNEKDRVCTLHAIETE